MRLHLVGAVVEVLEQDPKSFVVDEGAGVGGGQRIDDGDEAVGCCSAT